MSSVIQPFDDPKIRDDDLIIRSVRLFDLKENKSPPPPYERIASSLFQPSSTGDKGMSCFVERLLKNPKDCLNDPWVAAVSIKASYLRELGLKIGLTPDGNHPAHCTVWGSGKFPSSIKRKLITNCEVYAIQNTYKEELQNIFKSSS